MSVVALPGENKCGKERHVNRSDGLEIVGG
jgi:hypothetical protein